MKENLKERMYISEIAKYINKKDKRAAINWCNSHEINILADGRDRFVFLDDFISAYNYEYTLAKPITKRVKPTKPFYPPKNSYTVNLINDLLNE